MASSPVEQAGAHTRMEASVSRSATIGAITVSTRAFHASGSRKKLLTEMSRSRSSACDSAALSASSGRYCSSVLTLLKRRRRSSRRSTVDRLYILKS